MPTVVLCDSGGSNGVWMVDFIKEDQIADFSQCLISLQIILSER